MYVVVKYEKSDGCNPTAHILFLSESFDKAYSCYLDYMAEYVKAHEENYHMIEKHNGFSIVRHLYGYCSIGIHAIPVDKEVEVQI